MTTGLIRYGNSPSTKKKLNGDNFNEDDYCFDEIHKYDRNFLDSAWAIAEHVGSIDYTVPAHIKVTEDKSGVFDNEKYGKVVEFYIDVPRTTKGGIFGLFKKTEFDRTYIGFIGGSIAKRIINRIDNNKNLSINVNSPIVMNDYYDDRPPSPTIWGDSSYGINIVEH